jgi:hypothetical protein
MMHGLMQGMFWGGLVMALPPILLGIGIVVLIYRERRATRRAEQEVSGK